jgi:hypothetical protein
MPIKDLQLRFAKPSGCPHLLIWDAPTEEDLRRLAWREGADRISYRKDLLSRIDPNSRFLGLHHQFQDEIVAIERLCKRQAGCQPVVLLEDLDCLITYLYVQSNSPITRFWEALFKLRHLERILWIVLPSRILIPAIWDERRILKL